MAIKFIRLISYMYFFIFLHSQNGFGQDFSKSVIKCVFKDLTTQKAIPYVNIFNEKGKLISRANDSGYAVLKVNLDNGKIKLTAVNVWDSIIDINKLSFKDLNTIYLLPKSYELPEFVLNMSNSINGDSIWSAFLKKFNKRTKKHQERCLVQEHSLTSFNGSLTDYREVIKSVNRTNIGFNDSKLVKSRSVVDLKNDSVKLSWVNIDLLKLTESIGVQNFGDFLIETNPFKNFSDCLGMNVKSKFYSNNQLYYRFGFKSQPNCKNGLSGQILVNFSTGRISEITYRLIPPKNIFESLSGRYTISDLLIDYSIEFDEKDDMCNRQNYSMKYSIFKDNQKSPVVSNGQILLYFIDEEKIYSQYPSILKWRALNDFQLMDEVRLLGAELPFMDEGRYGFFKENFSASTSKQSVIDSARILIEKEGYINGFKQVIYEPMNGCFGFNFMAADSIIAEFIFTTELQLMPNYQLNIKPILISSFSDFLPEATVLKLRSCLEKQIDAELISLSNKINKLKIKNYDLLRSTYEVYMGKYIKQFNYGEKLSSACW